MNWKRTGKDHAVSVLNLPADKFTEAVDDIKDGNKYLNVINDVMIQEAEWDGDYRIKDVYQIHEKRNKHGNNKKRFGKVISRS